MNFSPNAKIQIRIKVWIGGKMPFLWPRVPCKSSFGALCPREASIRDDHLLRVDLVKEPLCPSGLSVICVQPAQRGQLSLSHPRGVCLCGSCPKWEATVVQGSLWGIVFNSEPTVALRASFDRLSWSKSVRLLSEFFKR